MKTRIVLHALIMTLSFNLIAADIVRHSRPVATIVLGAEPSRSVNMAAAELNYHIMLMTGVRLPVVETHPGDASTAFLLGGKAASGDTSDLKTGEYLICVKDKEISVYGCDYDDKGKFNYDDYKTFPSIWNSHGTLDGVYALLETFGVRWYLPTELGIAAPKKTDLSLPEGTSKFQPNCDFRYVNYRRLPANLIGDTLPSKPPIAALEQRQAELWALRSRLGGNQRLINHSLYRYHERFEERQDWMGVHSDGRSGQLCYSDDSLAMQVAQDARDFFDSKFTGKVNRYISNLPANYTSDCFPVVPMDGGSWCECDNCRRQYADGAVRGLGEYANDRYSNHVFMFVNKVAKEVKKTHPGKTIGALAYSSYAYPPEEFKLENNIEIVVCLHARAVFNKSLYENQEKVLAAWHQAYPNMRKNLWIYFCYPAMNGLQQKYRVFPGFFADHIGKLYDNFRELGVKGIFIEPSYLANSRVGGLFDQLDGYVNWRLAYDNKANAEEIIEEFFSLYYGPAEKPMQEFYRMAENAYCDPANWPVGVRHMTESIAWNSIGTRERMLELGRLMEQALAIAQEEPYRSRVELFNQGIWLYMLKGKEVADKTSKLRQSVMSRVAVPRLPAKAGDPLAVNWDDAAALAMYGGLRAEKPTRQIDVRVAHDGEHVYLRCSEKIDASTLIKDKQVSLNDEWEFFFANQRSMPYNYFAADSEKGTIALTFGTFSGPWTFPGKLLRHSDANSWTLYLSARLSDISPDGGTSAGKVLYFNTIRAASAKALGCWIPTFAGFHDAGSFGELYLTP